MLTDGRAINQENIAEALYRAASWGDRPVVAFWGLMKQGIRFPLR
jgi:hypothetical protein